MEKNTYGYIVLCIVAALLTIYIGSGLLFRYNKRLADRIQDLEKRVGKGIRSSLHRTSTFMNKYNEQERVLEKLRPKLELILYRLSKIENEKKSPSQSKRDKNDNKKNLSIEIDNKGIKFDAERLFDVLDADVSGDVTFDELNVILGLSELELGEFIRRMNEMADSTSNTTSVTRSVFVKYFLQVLTDTSNLTISNEEAEAIFNEMAGSSMLNEIDMQQFYASSMSVS